MLKEVQYFILWISSHIFKLLKRGYFLLVVSAAIITVIIFRWRVLCVNLESHLQIKQICDGYHNGQLIGNICEDLCQTKTVTSVSCHNLYSEKEAVFSAQLRNNTLVFKIIKNTPSLKLHFDNYVFPSEDEFIDIIKKNVNDNFNIAINDSYARILSHMKYLKLSTRNIEMQNIWNLLQDNEYLSMILYERLNIFPKIIGSCGAMYAIERINSISRFQHLVTVFNSHNDWIQRLKVAVLILDLIKNLEVKPMEPLIICDMKISHFGVTDDLKSVLYLDLDSVHPFSVVSRMTGDGSECKTHSDCDFKDCRSLCNLVTSKCQYGVVNNNLQMVCEKIFLGLSGKMMLPGLLMSMHTPRVLVEVLELCANPLGEQETPRAPASKDIQKRLYTLLNELKKS